MAIVVTPAIANPTYKSWTATALDADTTLTFNHGFGVAPDFVIVQPNVAASATAGLNVFTISAVSATQITVTKTAAVGSGGTTPGTTVVGKITAMLPNSAMQG